MNIFANARDRVFVVPKLYTFMWGKPIAWQCVISSETPGVFQKYPFVAMPIQNLFALALALSLSAAPVQELTEIGRIMQIREAKLVGLSGKVAISGSRWQPVIDPEKPSAQPVLSQVPVKRTCSFEWRGDAFRLQDVHEQEAGHGLRAELFSDKVYYSFPIHKEEEDQSLASGTMGPEIEAVYTPISFGHSHGQIAWSRIVLESKLKSQGKEDHATFGPVKVLVLQNQQGHLITMKLAERLGYFPVNVLIDMFPPGPENPGFTSTIEFNAVTVALIDSLPVTTEGHFRWRQAASGERSFEADERFELKDALANEKAKPVDASLPIGLKLHRIIGARSEVFRVGRDGKLVKEGLSRGLQ